MKHHCVPGIIRPQQWMAACRCRRLWRCGLTTKRTLRCAQAEHACKIVVSPRSLASVGIAGRRLGLQGPMKSRWLVALVLLSSSVGCDQVSKHAASQWLFGRPVQSYLGDTFRLLYTENTGAFLGMGSTWPELVRFIVFTLLSSALVVIALALLLARASAKDRPLAWAALVGGVLLLAGGVGNLIDRVFRHGAVVDFMNVGIGPLRSGIFNVADVQIVVGGLLLIWWERRNSRSTRAQPAPDLG